MGTVQEIMEAWFAELGLDISVRDSERLAKALSAARPEVPMPENPDPAARLAVAVSTIEPDATVIVSLVQPGRMTVLYSGQHPADRDTLGNVPLPAGLFAAPAAQAVKAHMLPETLPDDVLRYAMECSGRNNPDGARLVRSIYRFIREGLTSSTPAQEAANANASRMLAAISTLRIALCNAGAKQHMADRIALTALEATKEFAGAAQAQQPAAPASWEAERAEGAALLAALFHLMTLQQKNSAPPEFAERLGRFMFRNGYRVVFNNFWLQAAPDVVPAPVAAAAPVELTQARRTGYGEGVRAAADLVESAGERMIAARVRDLQSRAPVTLAEAIAREQIEARQLADEVDSEGGHVD